MLNGRQLLENGIVPVEYIQHMKMECECGGLILRNWKLTVTRCSNPYCYKHMAFRGARMLKYLGVKGCAEKTCETMIKNNQMKSHFELIPKIFKDEKPELFLWEIAKLACIDGYDDTCYNLFGKCSRFEDYFERAYMVPAEIKAAKDELISAQQYFEIKRPPLGEELVIMIHGNITGFQNRADYVAYLNDYCKDFVHIVEKGLGNDRQYLVTEDPNSGHRKNVRARKVGIPIVSPKEFEIIILQKVARKLGVSQERLEEILKGEG